MANPYTVEEILADLDHIEIDALRVLETKDTDISVLSKALQIGGMDFANQQTAILYSLVRDALRNLQKFSNFADRDFRNIFTQTPVCTNMLGDIYTVSIYPYPDFAEWLLDRVEDLIILVDELKVAYNRKNTNDLISILAAIRNLLKNDICVLRPIDLK